MQRCAAAIICRDSAPPLLLFGRFAYAAVNNARPAATYAPRRHGLAHRVEHLTGTARLPFCGTRHEREGKPAHSKTPFLYYTATSAAMQNAGGLRLGSACALALAGESPRPYVSGCMILGFMAAARSQACAPGPSCGAVWPPVPRFPAIRGCVSRRTAVSPCAQFCATPCRLWWGWEPTWL